MSRPPPPEIKYRQTTACKGTLIPMAARRSGTSIPHEVRKPHEALSLPIWNELLVGIEMVYLRSSDLYWGFGIPPGDGSAVVVIPGFLLTDLYLMEFRSWINRIGYKAYFSGIGLNAECANLLIQYTQMLSGMNVTPGRGIDFSQLGVILGVVALLYLLGASFSWMQGYLMAGVAQRTVFAMRRDVEAKLRRLPLQYFDTHPHGDLLSRVTNDLDNVTTTVQQGLSQLLTSVLTVVGVLAMMVWISPLLALISLVTVPLSIGVTLVIARRAQKQFAAQWEWTGTVNAHVEQTHTGHALVQVYGRTASTIDDFDGKNQQLYEASFRAQFLSGTMQPAMQLLANLNYVAIAVIGGYRVVSGTMTLGDIQAFIQYSRQFTMPITQIAGQMNLLQSGLASAERVFEFLAAEDEEPEVAEPAVASPPAGHVTLEHVAFRYVADKPL